jgi:hypothetical protein
MPYETQGPTGIVPALAGLASAYFQIKNENQKLKQDQQQQQQEISASKTSQAATRSQYGLGSDDKPTPLPWDAGPSSPAGSGAASGAAFEASQGAGGLPSGAPQAGMPTSPSAPSGTPNYTDPKYLKSQLDTWTQRYAMTRPGTYPNTLAAQEVKEYSSLLDNVGKGDMIPVKMPGGQTGYVPFSTAYTQGREDTRASMTHPMIAVQGPDGKTMMVPTGSVYTAGQTAGRQQATFGHEDTMQSRSFAHSDAQLASREAFTAGMAKWSKDNPGAYQKWVMSDRGPQAAITAAQTAARETDNWISHAQSAMNQQNSSSSAAGANPDMPQVGQFLQANIPIIRKHPELAAKTVQTINALPLTNGEKNLMTEAVRRAAQDGSLMNSAQSMAQKVYSVPSGDNPPNYDPGPPPDLP